MTTDDMTWLMRELDDLKSGIKSVDENVNDLRERVAKLESSWKTVTVVLTLGAAIVGAAVSALTQLT